MNKIIKEIHFKDNKGNLFILQQYKNKLFDLNIFDNKNTDKHIFTELNINKKRLNKIYKMWNINNDILRKNGFKEI